MLRWCERHGVSYIVGLARNQRLQRLIEADFAKVEQRFQAMSSKSPHKGATHALSSPISTAMPSSSTTKSTVPVARWRTASRMQATESADRISAHQWWTNQFRLLLSSLAYVLMETIRRLALHDTELAHAQVGTGCA